MEYAGYLATALLLVAGASFVKAIFCRDKPELFKFTAIGFATLACVGLILVLVDGSTQSKIPLLIFSVLSGIFYWFYRGTLKDNRLG